MTNHQHALAVRTLFGRRDSAAEHRFNAKHREELSRHLGGRYSFRLVTGGPVATDRLNRRYTLEDSTLREVDKLRTRQAKLILHADLGQTLPHKKQCRRIFVSERIEHHDVDDTEERCAGADGERERQYRDDGE